jgi:uncharacterized RDD family membrane protein YckC
VQQAHVQEHVEYASFGLRAVAVTIDTLIVLVGYSVVLAVAARAGWSELAFMRNMTLSDLSAASRSSPGWFIPVMYALVFVYFTLFELRGRTPGKRMLGLAVTRDGGLPAPPASIIVRNLVRIPEMMLYYIPSGISCIASPKNKRLGDFVGGTVVLRRSAAAPGLPVTGAAFGAQPPAVAFPPPAPAQVAQPPAADLTVPEALAALKAAALAVRGAHLNYLRFSERELTREASEGGYTPEYEAAWYTLSDSVMTMQHAYAEATVAATLAGTSVQESTAGQPDLAYLFAELEPYFEAESDAEVHEAYLSVARNESPA